MAKTVTRKQVVLNHLREHKTITSLEAFELYHITRLSAVIFDLRKLGYDIITDEQIANSQYGTTHYGKYILQSEPEPIADIEIQATPKLKLIDDKLF